VDYFTATLPPKVEQLVTELAADPDVRSLATPEQTPTTRGSYALYARRLRRLAETSPLASSEVANRRIWAVILDRAGGNRQGIKDALHLIETGHL